MMGLPCRERSLTISSDFWIQYTNVTDRRTERQTDTRRQQRPRLRKASRGNFTYLPQTHLSSTLTGVNSSNTNTEDHLWWLMSTFAQLLIQLTDVLCGCFSEPKESHCSILDLLEYLYRKTLSCVRVEWRTVSRGLRSPLQFVRVPLLLLSSSWSPLIRS